MSVTTVSAVTTCSTTTYTSSQMLRAASAVDAIHEEADKHNDTTNGTST